MSKALQPITPHVPREMLVAPFFAAVKQTAPRELTIDGRKWAIGIAHPTKRRESPALDMRHARACFALLSFRDRLKEGRTIHFSMNEFCRRYARSQGGEFILRIEDTDAKRNTPEAMAAILDGMRWLGLGSMVVLCHAALLGFRMT